MAILIPDSALSDAEITPGEKKTIRKFYQNLHDKLNYPGADFT